MQVQTHHTLCSPVLLRVPHLGVAWWSSSSWSAEQRLLCPYGIESGGWLSQEEGLHVGPGGVLGWPSVPQAWC